MWGFACKSSIDSFFTKQKKALRDNAWFCSLLLQNWRVAKILSIRGIIAKSAIFFLNKYHCQPDKLPQSVRDLIDTNAPKYCLDETDDSTQNWYATHNIPIYRNSLFFIGPMVFTDPELADLVTPRPEVSNIKSMVQKFLHKFEHRGDPEKWSESKFFIHEIQGIRKSKRIGAANIVI